MVLLKLFPRHNGGIKLFMLRKFFPGIGTDRPARRRPAALDRPGHSRGATAAGAGGGEMPMVSSKAAKDNLNALFGRIRQSSHCQQEEQLRAAAAVGGYHASEIGWSSQLSERRGQRTHGDRKGRLGLRQQPSR